MKNKKITLLVVIIILLCILVGGYILKNFFNISSEKQNLIDDWEYVSKQSHSDLSLKLLPSTSSNSGTLNSYESTSVLTDSTIGLSTGGAKNVENFRENIKNGYFPISTDITYNGLYYDYYFDTGRVEKSTELFSPSYSTAVSKDPVSGKLEYYMTVGLNSNIKQSDFQRKKLNLEVVLDISGSMSSGFNSYYYDGLDREELDEDSKKTKMTIANESVNLLIDELNEDDRLGIVLFDDQAYIAKPLNLVGETDIEKIKEHVLDIQPQGGTNFKAGYKIGTGLFSEEMLNNSDYENRIIVITDAMPNMGKTSKYSLAKDVEDNAGNKIYTSFIGVGVDFNTEVIECLSDVKGANYYSVHSSEEFKKIMGEEFDYMVTPLVFDLELNFKSDVFDIESVYGSDTVNASNGNIMKVNTLFPSSSNSSGEAKGGIILLKLKCNSTCGTSITEDIENGKISLSVSYKDRNGNAYSNSQEVKFEKAGIENYDNTGIRKGIVLTRYANLMKNWILYERTENRPEFLLTEVTGVTDCRYKSEEVYSILGVNERMSTKLSVSEEYKELFMKFKTYMEKEIEIIGDEEMKQEIELLNLLIQKI